MRKWRRGKCEMEEFLRKRKEWCREKRREHERQEEEKIKRIRTEQERMREMGVSNKLKEKIYNGDV